MKIDKIMARLLEGKSDSSFNFTDICYLLRGLGFAERIRGSHHVFRKEGLREHITLNADGNKARRYQVREVRKVILKHGLRGK